MIKKLIFLISVLLISSSLCAETITMKDGKVYKGNIHLENEQKVFIVQGTNFIELDKNEISEIKKDEEEKKKNTFDFDKDAPEVENTHEIIFKLGYEFYGEYTHKSNSKKSANTTGLNFSAEYYCYVSDIFGVGAGINLQNSRSAKFIPGKFYFMPMYVGLKLRSVPTEPYKYGYVTAHIGYNMIFMDSLYDEALVDETGGLYYAAGIGFVYSNVVVELLGSINNGDARYKGTNADIDMEYLKYTISVGYVFDI